MRFLDATQPPPPPDLSKPVLIYCRRSMEDKSTPAKSRECQKAAGYALAKQHFLGREVILYTDTDERN